MSACDIFGFLLTFVSILLTATGKKRFLHCLIKGLLKQITVNSTKPECKLSEPLLLFAEPMHSFLALLHSFVRLLKKAYLQVRTALLSGSFTT